MASSDDVRGRRWRGVGRGVAADASGSPSRLWFAGHWGSQYYAEQAGGRPVDWSRPTDCRPGDWVVRPVDNYGTAVPGVPIAVQGRIEVGTDAWLTTVVGPAGGGFYFSPGDRLPFVVGPVPPEAVEVDRVRR